MKQKKGMKTRNFAELGMEPYDFVFFWGIFRIFSTDVSDSVSFSCSHDWTEVVGKLTGCQG